MPLSMHIPSVGAVSFYIDTLAHISDGILLQGQDEERNNYVLKASKISWQEDFLAEYGWVHLVAYSVGGTTIKCDHFLSIG